MAYRSDTIATVINRVNRQYFLPAIQREFVWSPEQIVELFDSVMRGYPIGSLLFWDLQPENRDKWEIYRFIEAGRDGGVHNELANMNGISDVTLVLDGQQRLTAFTIGLRGSYTIKKKYMRWENPNAWVKQELHLNLLHDPKLDAESSDMGVRYDFRFLPKITAEAEHQTWFPVGRILDFDNDDRFDDFVEEQVERMPENVTKAEMRIVRHNLTRLRQSVWKDVDIAYYTEVDQDYDRVLDIFVRANEGGTKLSKSDLLLSMVTSKWSGINAREEIYSFVEHINHELVRRNNFDKDFVMKTCLVVTDLPVAYKVQNFSNANLNLIRANWNEIKSAIERTVNLVNSFGIDRDTLTSANALIPIVYYLFQRPTSTLLGTSMADARNRAAVRVWLVAALLSNVFGRSTDNVLTAARRVLQEAPSGPEFPIDALSSEIARSRGQSTGFTSVPEAILGLRYGGRESLLGLSLLYEPEGWGTGIFHQDHIFPRSLFTDKALATLGYDASRYRELAESFANLQLLREDENTAKLAAMPEDWLATRDHGFRQRHLIPEGMTLSLATFEEFIRRREELIRTRLTNTFGTTQAPQEDA